MAAPIRVLVKEPGKPPEERLLTPEPTDSGSLLLPLQHIVGGPIEMIRFLGSAVALFCNENGKLQGLAPNFSMSLAHRDMGRETIVGTVVFFRADSRRKSGIRSLSPVQVREIQRFLEDWSI